MALDTCSLLTYDLAYDSTLFLMFSKVLLMSLWNKALCFSLLNAQEQNISTISYCLDILRTYI